MFSPGPRQAQGIVDTALNKATSMVKDRLAGRGGKSSGGKKVCTAKDMPNTSKW